MFPEIAATQPLSLVEILFWLSPVCQSQLRKNIFAVSSVKVGLQLGNFRLYCFGSRSSQPVSVLPVFCSGQASSVCRINSKILPLSTVVCFATSLRGWIDTYSFSVNFIVGITVVVFGV